MSMFRNTIDFRKLYQITRDVTPLRDDCGKLCGSVCCLPDRDNSLGVYLFPGEEAMFTGDEEWLEWEQRDPVENDFPQSWSHPVCFLRCTKPCPREKRPLNCRFFPLAPHVLKDHTLLLILETLKLPYACPLIENKLPLRKDFIETVALCWLELLKDPRIRDLVVMDSRDREREGCNPHIVWWQL